MEGKSAGMGWLRGVAFSKWSVVTLMTLFCCAGCASERVSLWGDPPVRPPEEIVLKRWNTVSREDARELPKGPLGLERAIDEALGASPELAQIRYRIDAAQEQVRQVESAFYPRVVASEEFNTTDNPVFALMNIINQRRLQPTVNFNDPGRQQNFGTRVQGELLLFEGGTRWYDRKGTLDQKHSIEAELSAARNQLVAKVIETYYRWLQAIDFTSVAERAVESAQTDESFGEVRVKVEMSLPSELMRLKARTAEARSNLVSAKTAVRRLKAALERLMARPLLAEEIPEASGKDALPPDPVPNTDDPQSLVARAMEKRPEMASVRALIEAARNRVKSARGGLLPKLGANAQYLHDSEELHDGADSWMVAVQATWPLFEGGITLAKIREARAHLEEVQARGGQMALDIALEVQQASLAVEEAAEKINVARERRLWAERALEDVRQQYQGQVVTVDALLQAEVASNEAEASYTGALFEAKVAQAVLKRSLGDFAGGLQ
jgi:outer membrane protein